jgi:hypothetical protein
LIYLPASRLPGKKIPKHVDMSLCNQRFVNTNQSHSCGDKVLADFLKGKSDHTLSLFWYFVEQYQLLGKVTIHPTKSMIAFAGRTRIAYVIDWGKIL